MMEGIILDFFFRFIYKPNIKYSKNKIKCYEVFEEFDCDFGSRPQHQRKRNNKIKSNTKHKHKRTKSYMYDVIFLTTKKVNLIHICGKYDYHNLFENIGTWDTSPGNLRPSII